MGNIGLVYIAARRFSDSGVPFDDLISEGSIGLLRAVEGFDIERGIKFSTYAFRAIARFMFRAVQDGVGVIRLPRSAPEPDRVGGRMRIRRSRFAREILAARRFARFVLSLNVPAKGGERPLGETIAARAEVEGDHDNSSALARHLGELTERQRRVLHWAYGLDGDEPWTNEQIGKALGVSKQRACQIEQLARKRLRESFGLEPRSIRYEHGGLDHLRGGHRAGSDAITGAKLTEAQVIEIKRRLVAGEGTKALSGEFAVDPATIRSIARNESWAHIDWASLGLPAVPERSRALHWIPSKVAEVAAMYESGASTAEIAIAFDTAPYNIRRVRRQLINKRVASPP
jgi:RNA polymerase sigma factor (sigma-70 family)